MKICIDEASKRMTVQTGGATTDFELYGQDAFELVSNLWLKLGWQQKYPYTFSWLGRPIIQHPEDMVRIQDLIFRDRPDLVIETGVAHGGSLIYYASLMQLLGKGRVVGIDIEIRPGNRKAIEAHPMKPLITLIEGNSVGEEVVEQVRAQIEPGNRVMVILDSNHSRDHVRAELEAYHDMVSIGSWLLVQDGIMKLVHDAPRADPSWDIDNPVTAIHDFLRTHDNFVIDQPPWTFNESELTRNITAHSDGWLRRTT